MSQERYQCRDCDKIFPENVTGNELFCPECDGRLDSCYIANTSNDINKQNHSVTGSTVEKDYSGFFAPEKKGIDKGVAGGILMIIIALVWFIVGYMAGWVFYYPPILGIIGLYAILKGLFTGNLSGGKQTNILDTRELSAAKNAQTNQEEAPPQECQDQSEVKLISGDEKNKLRNHVIKKLENDLASYPAGSFKAREIKSSLEKMRNNLNK